MFTKLEGTCSGHGRRHDKSGDRYLSLSHSDTERGSRDDRLVVTRSKFLRVEGILQNHDKVVHIKAVRLLELPGGEPEMYSHDFH